MARLGIGNFLLLLLTVCCTIVRAGGHNQVQFYHADARYGVAITSALFDNGTQVRIQFAAPTYYGWAALGSGHMMDGSVMFIIYPNEAGDGVTLSIRSTKGHHAPTLLDSSSIDARLYNSSIEDGIMSAWIEWRGDTRGVIYDACDVKDEKQPFIWSTGPNQTIASDDVNFPIRQHSDRGVFFANMPQSQNMDIEEPRIVGTTSVKTRPQLGAYYQLIAAHAILLATAFVVIFPSAVVGLRLNLPNSFKIHWMTQVSGSVGVIIGFSIAVATSIIGIRYDQLNEPHQIVGIIICLLLALQVYFGREHHIHYVLWKKRTWYTMVHTGLGRIVMYGGMTNAVLGFVLAGLRQFAIILGVANIVIIIVVEFMSARFHMKRSKNQVAETEPMVLKDYYKLKSVTVTEHTVDEVEAQSGYTYQ